MQRDAVVRGGVDCMLKHDFAVLVRDICIIIGVDQCQVVFVILCKLSILAAADVLSKAIFAKPSACQERCEEIEQHRYPGKRRKNRDRACDPICARQCSDI